MNRVYGDTLRGRHDYIIALLSGDSPPDLPDSCVEAMIGCKWLTSAGELAVDGHWAAKYFRELREQAPDEYEDALTPEPIFVVDVRIPGGPTLTFPPKVDRSE